MSPTEYYERCAKIFNTSVSHLKSTREIDKNTLRKLRDVINIYKRKLCLPMINYADEGQEGLHRMLIVAEMFGWNHKVPVLVVDYYDKDLANKRKQEALKRKIDSKVETAIQQTLEYQYKDIDEISDQLQWELDRQFEFEEDIETPVKFELYTSSNSVTLTVFGYDYPIDIEDIKLNSNNNEAELDDVEDIDDWLVNYLGDDWMDKFPDAKKKIERNI